MTVRIALLTADDAPDGPGPATAAAAPDVEVRRLDVRTVPPEHLEGADGLWVAPGAAGRAGPVLGRARSAGVPVGGDAPGAPPWDGPGLDPAFVDAARARSGWRTATEERVAAEAARAAEEARPRPFVHQMRGPRHRWWRPLLWLLVLVVTYAVLAVVLLLPLTLLGLVPTDEADIVSTPSGLAVLNATLIILVPAVLLASWVAHRRSPWRVFSVAVRLRWGWLGVCLLVVLPVWVVYLALSWVAFDQEVLPRPAGWVGLVVAGLLLTPLQATAEEVFFRGGLVQAVGSWFRSPVVALVLTTVLSTGLFAAAHGSADPWIVAELASLAVAGCYLAWRTGGLEAVIAMHVVNNVLITLMGALLGGLDESFVDTGSTGSPVSAAMSWVVTGLATWLLLRVAVRRGVAPAGAFTPAVG